jgi:hypothetical protein
MIKNSALAALSYATLATVFFGRLVPGQAAPPSGESQEDASFKPLVEAPLPDGFPTYTPVGAIEIKSYPAYRKAETSGRMAFWQLFQHISSAGISMTAPVEMTYQEAGPPVGRERAMAFLYGNKSIGSTGRKGSVGVVDVPATTVVSIGMRGARTETDLMRAEQQLREWLAANKQHYEQSGAVRVMGYNSPFVARDRQFYEVQIPLRELSAESR